ncbi:MAG: phosphate ABC transporter substrate-binding/OmpA family protein [Planctomycetaceae bacterium]|jgi:NitT/TauT family transport system substrate-binding protein
MSGSGRPTPVFYIAVLAVIGGLVYFAGRQAGMFGDPEPANVAPAPAGGDGEDLIDPAKLGTGQAEQSSDDIVTTVKEYAFVPSEKLPPVKGTAEYRALEDNTVRFALNVWAGWAPIIHANEGFQPSKIWQTPDGKEFKVHLILADDPVAMRDAYANGDFHIGWATVDMLPLFMEGFVDASGEARDSRIMPRIFQQVDWSNGGDGIVVRDNIKTVADLRGKTIVLAQNSPSQYFALSMLVAGGVQPNEVTFKNTNDAFEAAAAFNSDKSIAACVSWAPDIYTLSEQAGNRMLVNTETANKLIADVWYARADFAQDHPDLIEGIVRGIFDSVESLKDQAEKQKVAGWMASGYAIPQDECLGMLGDAHSTNYAENREFFLNQNNPARFESVWNQAYYIYRRIRSVTHQPVPFDQVVDFSIIQKLGNEEKYSSQRNEYRVRFAPKATSDIVAESDEVLTNTVIIHFAANDHNLAHKVIRKNSDGEEVEDLYDPNVDFVLEEIAKLVVQFGAARVIIEGHTDASMKSVLPDDVLVKQLAGNRANSVKEALVERFQLDPNQLNSDGIGWDRPADPQDPGNHAKNRRVEIRVFSAEVE